MSKESNLWALLRDKLLDFHFQRIETGMTWLAKRAMHGGQVFVLARKNDVIKLFHVDGLEGAHELVKNGFKSDALVTLTIPYAWEVLSSALLS